MNLILWRDDEILSPGLARLQGDRARHLVEVLGCEVGRRLRVGQPDGLRGWAEVVAVQEIGSASEFEVTLSFALEGSIPARPRFDLILAMPRPIVLKRLLEHVATLGVSRILLTNAARVEKSYFQSAVLEPEVYREHLLRGLEQAGCTRVPRLDVFGRFRRLLEDDLDARLGDSHRLVAHPRGAQRLAEFDFESHTRVAIAIGPEGGWQDFEVELLEAEGFDAVSFGSRVLRVETACTLALAQLDLLVPGSSQSD